MRRLRKPRLPQKIFSPSALSQTTLNARRKRVREHKYSGVNSKVWCDWTLRVKRVAECALFADSGGRRRSEVGMVQHVGKGGFEAQTPVLVDGELLGQAAAHGDGARRFQYPYARFADSSNACGRRTGCLQPDREFVLSQPRRLRRDSISDRTSLQEDKSSAT